MFNVLSELIMTVQHLISRGWKFKFEAGERKFANSMLIATNGNKTRFGYEGETVDGFLEMIVQEELNEWTERLIKWNGFCPNCEIKPPINVYSCDKCGWAL